MKKIFAILILVILAGYFIYNKNIITKDGIKYERINNSEVKIVFKKYFEEGGDGVVFPQIESGINEEIKNKINKELKFGNCFPLPDDEDSLLFIHKMYMYEVAKKEGLDFDRSEKQYTAVDKKIEALSYEETRQKLMDEFYYEDFLDSKVSFNKNNVLSVFYNYVMNCGGVHPISGLVGANFDLLSGDQIYFKDLFADYGKDEEAIVDIIAKKLDEELYAGVDNCDTYTKSLKGGEVDLVYSDYILNDDGIKLISLNYPYASKQCDINPGIQIPTSLLSKYLKKDGIVSRINK